MISKWPEYDPAREYPEEEKDTELVISAIRAIRNIRQELRLKLS